jgi:hypothetical protein
MKKKNHPMKKSRLKEWVRSAHNLRGMAVVLQDPVARSLHEKLASGITELTDEIVFLQKELRRSRLRSNTYWTKEKILGIIRNEVIFYSEMKTPQAESYAEAYRMLHKNLRQVPCDEVIEIMPVKKRRV